MTTDMITPIHREYFVYSRSSVRPMNIRFNILFDILTPYLNVYDKCYPLTVHVLCPFPPHQKILAMSLPILPSVLYNRDSAHQQEATNPRHF